MYCVAKDFLCNDLVDFEHESHLYLEFHVAYVVGLCLVFVIFVLCVASTCVLCCVCVYAILKCAHVFDLCVCSCFSIELF